MKRYPLLAAALAGTLSAQPPRQDPNARPPAIPKSGSVPHEAKAEQKLQAEFKAPPGFNVTLFAGPPIAMYPTCVAEAPDGAIFTCVDPNLSLSTLKGVGRVMRLVDTNNDGRADTYTTFAEMDSPRGAVFDGQTLYVMHPPNLTAYRDTNGDGIADESRDIVTGLGFDLDFRGADHTTNNIQMGPDGWLYVAVGDYGFIKAVGSDGTQIQNRGGAVVRVRPDGTNLEIVARGTRNIYDVAIDPFAHLFTRDNTNDGDGWNTRLHYVPAGAFMGYPNLYQNFATEHFPTMFDYGPGSGVGDLWIQDPAWPEGFNNTLYTGDWTVQKILRHPLTPKGASFAVQQEDFINVLRPADLILDGNSNLYVASLSGGQFTYASDTVGYIVRVNYTGKPASKAPDYKAASDAQLVTTLSAPAYVHRVHAMEELVRRAAQGGPKDATLAALRQAVAATSATPDARAAAMFTLKQLAGAGANATLTAATADANPRVREIALRTLADRRDQLGGVTSAPFVKGLRDADVHVRVQAINGLVRIGARDAADALVPLAASDDQALSHLAINALVSLDARDAALKAVDAGPAAARTAALRALAMMHDPLTVSALLTRLDRAPDAASRGALLHTLARLHNREGYWRGDWWTTKPAHLGPYFDPAAWQESPRIRAALSRSLASASGAELETLADDLVLNQVLPRGAKPLLVALAAARDPQRGQAIDALVGRSQLDAGSATLAMALDAKSPALHAAVAQLLAGESSFGAGTLPLVRTAVLDPKLDPAIRGQLLTAMAQVPGQQGLDVAAEVFGRLTPVPGLSAAATPTAAAAASPTPPAGSAGAGDPVETAWRRFVGDRRRLQELPYFINLARTGAPAQRTLAYAVLVQSIRGPRVPPQVRDGVTPVIDAAWTDPASAPALVQAITLMRVESQYTEKLQAYGQQRKP